MATKRKTKGAAEIYQFEITLLGGIEPRIWRRFAAQADMTLADLHDVIQIVMGWWDEHLHQFVIKGKSYGMPSVDLDFIDASQVKLRDVVTRRGNKFVYEYDFGDCWQHELEVLERGPRETDVRYPVCLAGERACPPEDCGGVWGYEELLETIADPSHDEHERMMEWVGEEFDPEAFDPDQINQKLHRVWSGM